MVSIMPSGRASGMRRRSSRPASRKLSRFHWLLKATRVAARAETSCVNPKWWSRGPLCASWTG